MIWKRPSLPSTLLFLACQTGAVAAGPADRVATDPRSIVSPRQPHAQAVDVADVTTTVRITDATVSRDGSHIAYIGDASGRLNLWMMPAAGGEARALTHSNEHQLGPVFTHDGRELVYMQDIGGDELYDLYAVDVGGSEPRNITHTPQTSETNPFFSPDGA